MVACAVAIAAISVRTALTPALGSHSPLLPALAAVLVAVVMSGRGPGRVAIALCSMITTLAVYPWPTDTELAQWIGHLVLFITSGVLITEVVHSLQLLHRRQLASMHVAREAVAHAQAAAAQLRLIADSVPVLIAYVDSQHRYRFNNRQYEEWFGVEATGLQGKHVREVLGNAAYDTLKPRMQQALEGEAAHFEGEVPYRTGGTRHVSVHYVPDMDAAANVRGFFALIEDVSEHRRTSHELQRAYQTLSLALRAGRSGSFEWDIKTNINRWSPQMQELHGFAPGQFDGTYEAWLATIDPEDVERMKTLSAQALQRGELLVEYRIRRHDTGETRWLEGRGKVFYDVHSKPERMLGITVDITERMRVEAALRDAERRKDEFLAMLSHEMRNPLAAIVNGTVLLNQPALDANRIRSVGELLQRQTAQLTRIVDDLLDVARISRGAVELHREIINIETTIDAAIEALKPQLDRKQQRVNVVRASQRSMVDADRLRLCQVFSNLISNASKYSALHNLITVIIEERDPHVVIRVRDEGQGIEAQLLPLVFELFTQGERALDRRDGGLGIGLTIVRSLIQMHGGTVEARSAGRGQGSEFIVRLPLCRQPAESPPALVRPTEAKRILLVDDNADAVETLALLLQSEGHLVRVCHDGARALHELTRYDAQVILLDIGLPIMDGYELAKAIRARPETSQVVLVALTGYGRPEDRDAALRAGFDEHLAKPVSIDRILELLCRQSNRHSEAIKEQPAALAASAAGTSIDRDHGVDA